MKRQNQIGKELRDSGRMFSEGFLKKQLEAVTPIFSEGKIVFYPDNTAEVIAPNFKMRPVPILLAIDIVPVEPAPKEATQLDRIEEVVNEMCNRLEELELQVHRMKTEFIFKPRVVEASVM